MIVGFLFVYFGQIWLAAALLETAIGRLLAKIRGFHAKKNREVAACNLEAGQISCMDGRMVMTKAAMENGHPRLMGKSPASLKQI